MKQFLLIRRKYIILIVLTLILAIVAGLFIYTNYQKRNRSNCYGVSNGSIDGLSLIEQYSDFTPSFLLSDDLLDQDILERIEKEFEIAPTLVICQAEGWFRQVHDASEQDIRILRVVRGDQSLENQVVTCTMLSAFLFQQKIVTRTFINFMNPEDTYLVALYPYGTIVNSENGPEPVDVQKSGWYTMNFDYTCIQYFNLEEKNNVIVETEETGTFATTPYKALKDNEFFCTSKQALDKITDVKIRVLEKYVPAEWN